MFGIIRACQTVTNFTNLFFQSLENIIPKKTSKVFMKDNKKGAIFLKKICFKGFYCRIYNINNYYFIF